MEKTILVTGKDTYLGSEVSQFFLDQGCRVAATVAPRKEAYPTVELDNRLLVFPWTKRSPISAKNFILQTLNQFGSLQEAFVIFSPEKEAPSLPDVPVIEIEERIDAQFKGLVFLCRELLALQAQNPLLALNFVVFDEEVNDQPPLASSLYFAFKGLVNGLLLQSQKRALPVWGFESQAPQTEGFSNFILNHPRQDPKASLPGRWHVFGEKKNFFQSFFKSK